MTYGAVVGLLNAERAGVQVCWRVLSKLPHSCCLSHASIFSTTDKRIANGNPSPLSGFPQAEKTDCHSTDPKDRLRNESEVSGVAVWNVAKSACPTQAGF